MLEHEPLMRLLVLPAVRRLGFAVAAADGAGSAAVAAVFVPLDRGGDCRRACEAARGGPAPRAGRAGAAPLVAGYAAGPHGLLAAHRAHRCADLVLRLTADVAGPCFAHLPSSDAVRAAGLTEREADVLVLLLDGLTTTSVARRLCVSPSTARSHCRAVLRKLGARDRRALRDALLEAGAPAAVRTGVRRSPLSPSPACVVFRAACEGRGAPGTEGADSGAHAEAAEAAAVAVRGQAADDGAQPSASKTSPVSSLG